MHKPLESDTREPLFSAKKKIAAVIASAAVALTGCSAGRGEPAPAPTEITTTAPQNPTPEASPTTSETTETSPNTYTGVEAIGQNEEIPRDQLNILQQTTSVEAMLEMSDNELANESVGNRAALGYYLIKKILLDNQQEYNVNPIDADIISFYRDPESGIRGGYMVLEAISHQTSSLTRATPEEARALAFTDWYRATDAAGNVPPHIQNSVEFNQKIADMDIVTVRTPDAVRETGWFKASNGEWVKIIHERAVGDDDLEDIDRTAAYARITVTLDSGETVFFYMRVSASERQAGDLIEEFVDKLLK